MKALIYDPYLDTLGGGERYCLTVAEYLLKEGWRVDIPWQDKSIVEKAKERFSLELEGLGVVEEEVVHANWWNKLKLFKNYDLIFWLSDGSIPFLFGRKNLLHFQVPFVSIKGKNLFNQLKLRFIDQIICNSRFTKKFIDKGLRVDSIVLYPPVDVERFKPGKKENVILGVGRFEETMQAKRQDILIQAFVKLVSQGVEDWKLVLIGGSLQSPAKNQYLKRLRRMARNYPIEFLINVPFGVLKNYYQRAKIFWHGAGFGVDEKTEPYRVEHFGITTVEAMAAGCVPVVIDKGGLREIVRRGVGERWSTVEELVQKTFRVIGDRSLFNIYQRNSIKAAKKFSKINFCKKLEEIVKKE